MGREYNAAQDQETYDFGAVLLLPKELIQHQVKVTRGTAQELADSCGCSVELVKSPDQAMLTVESAPA